MALPPPQPVYILRGHAAQVHALEFSATNSSLLSGDAEGYVVCWNLASKRATASWRAHSSAVLGVAWLTEDIIITHGRDSQLHMWKLGPGLDTVLPVDRHSNSDLPTGKSPTLFNSLTVNTLNFCAFAWRRCYSKEDSLSFVLALPHTLSSEAVDIFRIIITSLESDIPSVEAIRKTTVLPPDLKNPKTGLTMCLAFETDHKLLVGYESGHTIIYVREHQKSLNEDDGTLWEFKPNYISRPHSQPILSIQQITGRQMCVTVGADSKLAVHSIHATTSELQDLTETEPYHTLDTKHAGQQGLSVRDDGALVATAGWGGKGRLYKAPTMKTGTDSEYTPPKEVAVLKWHKEGCYCTAFAHVLSNREEDSFENQEGAESSGTLITRSQSVQIQTAAGRREQKAKDTHWLALGSKDGKISLWDFP